MHFAVNTGNLLRCVEAPDAAEAIRRAILLHLKNHHDDPDECDPLEPGDLFEIAVAGQPGSENMFGSTDKVMDEMIEEGLLTRNIDERAASYDTDAEQVER